MLFATFGEGARGGIFLNYNLDSHLTSALCHMVGLVKCISKTFNRV